MNKINLNLMKNSIFFIFAFILIYLINHKNKRNIKFLFLGSIIFLIILSVCNYLFNIKKINEKFNNNVSFPVNARKLWIYFPKRDKNNEIDTSNDIENKTLNLLGIELFDKKGNLIDLTKMKISTYDKLEHGWYPDKADLFDEQPLKKILDINNTNNYYNTKCILELDFLKNIKISKLNIKISKDSTISRLGDENTFAYIRLFNDMFKLNPSDYDNVNQKLESSFLQYFSTHHFGNNMFVYENKFDNALLNENNNEYDFYEFLTYQLDNNQKCSTNLQCVSNFCTNNKICEKNICGYFGNDIVISEKNDDTLYKCVGREVCNNRGIPLKPWNDSISKCKCDEKWKDLGDNCGNNDNQLNILARWIKIETKILDSILGFTYIGIFDINGNDIGVDKNISFRFDDTGNLNNNSFELFIDPLKRNSQLITQSIVDSNPVSISNPVRYLEIDLKSNKKIGSIKLFLKDNPNNIQKVNNLELLFIRDNCDNNREVVNKFLLSKTNFAKELFNRSIFILNETPGDGNDIDPMSLFKEKLKTDEYPLINLELKKHVVDQNNSNDNEIYESEHYHKFPFYHKHTHKHLKDHVSDEKNVGIDSLLAKSKYVNKILATYDNFDEAQVSMCTFLEEIPKNNYLGIVKVLNKDNRYVYEVRFGDSLVESSNSNTWIKKIFEKTNLQDCKNYRKNITVKKNNEIIPKIDLIEVGPYLNKDNNPVNIGKNRFLSKNYYCNNILNEVPSSGICEDESSSKIEIDKLDSNDEFLPDNCTYNEKWRKTYIMYDLNFNHEIETFVIANTFGEAIPKKVLLVGTNNKLSNEDISNIEIPIENNNNLLVNNSNTTIVDIEQELNEKQKYTNSKIYINLKRSIFGRYIYVFIIDLYAKYRAQIDYVGFIGKRSPNMPIDYIKNNVDGNVNLINANNYMEYCKKNNLNSCNLANKKYLSAKNNFVAAFESKVPNTEWINSCYKNCGIMDYKCFNEKCNGNYFS